MMLEYLAWIYFEYTCTTISYLFYEYVYAIIHMLVGGIVKYS